MNISWMRQPRYSPLGLAVILILTLGAARLALSEVVGKYEEGLQRIIALTEREIGTSPLPNVVLALKSKEPIKSAYLKKYDLTIDYFSTNQPVWEKALEPFSGKPGVSYLEIGTYEGSSAVWMLEHILTDPTARLTAVDIFDGPYKERYLANIALSGAAEKVTTLTGYSQVVLRGLPLDSFDIIYVDGSHARADVLEDAVLCWRLLRKDGLLIFDDYRFASELDIHYASPKMAIDSFVQNFGDRCEVIHNDYQLIVRKKS